MPTRLLAAPMGLVLLVSALGMTRAPRPPQAPVAGQAPPPGVIPRPVSIEISPGTAFTITPATAILYEPADDPRVAGIASKLATLLTPALPSAPPLRPASGTPLPGSILLSAKAAGADTGDEGYDLSITADGVRIAAST